MNHVQVSKKGRGRPKKVTNDAFEFNKKTFFLTYARCDISKEVLLSFLEEKGTIQEYIIATEEHKDLGLHLHCYIKYHTALHSTNPRFFDYNGFHPNIATISKTECIKAVKTYVRKGKDFITNIEVLGRKELLLQKIAREGITKEFVLENPEILGYNFSSLMSWNKWIHSETFGPISQLPKLRHYWVHGDANTGKSTWLRNLLSKEKLKSGQIPYNNDWSGIDQETEVIYADEFKGHITVQLLNSICDGRIKLNTKGGSTRISYPRVIVCSNFSPEDCYHNCRDVEFAAIRARFRVFRAGHEELPNEY